MKKILLSLLVLLSILPLITACSTNTDSGDTNDTSYSHTIEDGENAIKEFEDESGEINGEEAAETANEVNHFRYDLDQTIKRADSDLDSGALTKEEHDDVVGKLNELKSRAETLSNDLRTKAGDAASTIREDASIATEKYEEVSELDHFIEDTDHYLTTIQSSIVYMSGNAVEHNKELVTAFDKHIDNARNQLDVLLKDKKIDQESYDKYNGDLTALKNTSSNVLKDIDEDT